MDDLDDDVLVASGHESLLSVFDASEWMSVALNVFALIAGGNKSGYVRSLLMFLSVLLCGCQYPHPKPLITPSAMDLDERIRTERYFVRVGELHWDGGGIHVISTSGSHAIISIASAKPIRVKEGQWIAGADNVNGGIRVDRIDSIDRRVFFYNTLKIDVVPAGAFD